MSHVIEKAVSDLSDTPAFKLMECVVNNFYYLKERSWFMRNPNLQAKLSRVICKGLGPKVNVVAPEFEEHLDELLREYDNAGKIEPAILKKLQTHVSDFDYLRTRGWFMRNPKLQSKLLDVVNKGLGEKVIVTYPEFEWHLENLLSGGAKALAWMEDEVPDFYYLKERSWFMRSEALKEKLLEVVRRDMGHRVDVVAPEFEEHLDHLLDL